MIRYVITAIKKDGRRHMAFDNNSSRNAYVTPEEAQTMLDNVIKNNNPERIANDVGTDLQVRPVECYASGDAIGTVFDS